MNLSSGIARGIAMWTETKPGQLRLNVLIVAGNGGYSQQYRRLRIGNTHAISTRVQRRGSVAPEDVCDTYAMQAY
jgi:hypothetical protein